MTLSIKMEIKSNLGAKYSLALFYIACESTTETLSGVVNRCETVTHQHTFSIKTVSSCLNRLLSLLIVVGAWIRVSYKRGLISQWWNAYFTILMRVQQQTQQTMRTWHRILTWTTYRAWETQHTLTYCSPQVWSMKTERHKKPDHKLLTCMINGHILTPNTATAVLQNFTSLKLKTLVLPLWLQMSLWFELRKTVVTPTICFLPPDDWWTTLE